MKEKIFLDSLGLLFEIEKINDDNFALYLVLEDNRRIKLTVRYSEKQCFDIIESINFLNLNK